LTSRSEIYAAIDTEREYQKCLKRKGQETQIGAGKMCHWAMDLVTIEEIIQRLKAYAYENAGDPPMDFFRKIAGVAVHTMENYGAPKRAL
jgi:hypothetical protein